MTELKIESGLWPEDKEGVLAAWNVDDGGRVNKGDIIAEITVEKAQMEYEAPVSGTLHHRMEEGSVLSSGDLIGVID